MRKIMATVKIRRGEGWDVRPNAEQIDGKRHIFTFGWHITEEDRGDYAGETAWVSDREGWPPDAPIWIASGDLTDICAVHMPPKWSIPTRKLTNAELDELTK